MYFTVYRLGVKPYTDLYINVIIYKYILIIKHKISPLLCFSGFCRPSTKIDKCSPPYTQQGNKSLLLYITTFNLLIHVFIRQAPNTHKRKS